MKFQVSYYTDQGKRPKNEDSVSILQKKENLLALVADGLGGYVNGEVASGQAIAVINEELKSLSPDEDRLIEAIGAASDYIYQQQISEQPMLTTIAVLWIGETEAIVANVGDSRIYQFRGNEIIYQTEDHSVAQIAVVMGEITQDEIRHYRDRNQLTRVLGNEELPKVDCETLSVEEGDCFLLCSDGFWEVITEQAMLEVLSRTESAEEWLMAMKLMIERADRSGQDNHTAIVVKCS